MHMDEWVRRLEGWMEEVASYQREARRHMTVAEKEHELDYVTNIDVKSEEMLISRISEAYPDHSILTEERGLLDRGSDYLWVIDPIDGTTNFIHGFPMWCISVGLQYKGITQFGLVYAPSLNMRFSAERNKGAFLNGERIEVSRTAELRNSLLSTGFPAGSSKPNPNLPYFKAVIGEVSGIRRTGSAALDLCFVAVSYLDGYWEFNLNAWDICAGLLIVEEAGGRVKHTGLEGHSLLVCGNPGICDLLQARLMEAAAVI